ncbi:hypothetical protein THAOC_30261 [Thalassiosira oceanica]|uniref:Uncharacterized protein n=1 Tax=Thalassiosira oceanica TaxID=159749 RepID=K0RAN4_THAOC|nr:hypothetical protein THAOC_30261 [Thalassiosira oceanica]|eukprot:EJK50698.1 hypothetical protein THAOC_30261 [Thalassiosira oceanica]
MILRLYQAWNQREIVGRPSIRGCGNCGTVDSGSTKPSLVEDDSPAQASRPTRRYRSQIERLNADEYKESSRGGNLGRNRSGRSKRITAATQARAPTKVQSALRAKIKYIQSMRSRREIEDNMLSFAKTEYRSRRDTVTVDHPWTIS